MIELHYWTTPNGHKIRIFLEESRLPYRIIPAIGTAPHGHPHRDDHRR